MKRHQQTVHGQGENNQFKCSQCEKMFSRKFDLNRHNKHFIIKIMFSFLYPRLNLFVV